MKDKKEVGRWFPEKIDGDDLQRIAHWLNSWGDFYEHEKCLDDKSIITVDGKPKNNHITDFGSGYECAISDVITKLGLDFKMFDKRTKTGFRKER
jgi:hypothetical protein